MNKNELVYKLANLRFNLNLKNYDKKLLLKELDDIITYIIDTPEEKITKCSIIKGITEERIIK